MFPRKNPAQLDECPYACPGRDKSHQRPRSESELVRLSSSARRAVERAHGQVLICEYCGGVHLREPHANVPLGMLDGVAGPGWHSNNFAWPATSIFQLRKSPAAPRRYSANFI